MNTKLKTLVGITALASLPLLLWSADDTDISVRVVTKERVLRATQDYSETNTLIRLRVALFIIRFEDGVRVGEQQLDSATWTKAQLLAAGKDVMVNQLENVPVWTKNNWPVVPPPEPPAP